MTRAEKIIKNVHYVVKDKQGVVFYPVGDIIGYMKESAWQAWNFSCEAFYKLNGMPYTNKQIEIERRAFEIFWSEELKENDK